MKKWKVTIKKVHSTIGNLYHPLYDVKEKAQQELLSLKSEERRSSEKVSPILWELLEV